MKIFFYHACRNKICALYMMRSPGAIPGTCPRCGWVRTLASITTRAT